MKPFPMSILLVAALLPAQSPKAVPAAAAEQLAAAKTKVLAALQKTAALDDTAFTATWGPYTKAGADDALARAIGGGSYRVSGDWHKDLLHVKFDGAEQDELLLAGRRTLARDGKNGWQLRANRFADGNDVPFVPDGQALLRLLARCELDVTQRAVSSLDDRPVEVVSVTLTPAQVADATWAGLLPKGAGGVFAIAVGGGAGRQPATAPDATVDLAIAFDPATSTVQEVRLRRHEKLGGVAGRVFVARGGGIAVANNNGADDDDEPEQAADAPLEYVDGLPKRPRKGLVVTDFALRLSNHGKVEAPPLTDEQKLLLGR